VTGPDNASWDNYIWSGIMPNRGQIGITIFQVDPAIRALLNANTLYKVGGWSRISESRHEAGARLGAQNSTTEGSSTLRKEWVVSVTGDREAAFNTATTPTMMNNGANPGYESMGKAAIHGDFIKFLEDAYLHPSRAMTERSYCGQLTVDHVEGSNAMGAAPRRQWWGTAMLVLGLVVSLAACGDDDDDDEAGLDGGAVEVTFEDDRDDLEGTIQSCESQDDASIALRAEGEGYTIEIEAVDGRGSIVVTGDTEVDGEVTSVEVTDTGDASVEGETLPADDGDGSEPTPFEATANC
jgi:hypothetical protein